MNVESFDQMMRDMYARPGEVIKQYVVDMGRESEWERETCPRVTVPVHDDNTGLQCRNSYSSQWSYLDHDCCYVCNDLYRAHAGDMDIAAWRMERALRPPICADKTKLSDQIAPPLPSMRDNPIFQALKKR